MQNMLKTSVFKENSPGLACMINDLFFRFC